VFFSPPTMLVDPKVRDKLIPILQNFVDVSGFGKQQSKATGPPQNFLAKAAAADCSASPLPDGCKDYEILSQASLNTVRVLVGGIMTVDVNNIPAKIDSVDVDVPASSTAADVWKTPGAITGSIRGSFLSGGQPSVAESNIVENVTAVQDGSTDKVLHFKLTLKAAAASPQKLTFKVTKKNSQGGTVDSSPFPYEIPAPTPSTSSPTATGGAASTSPATPQSR
jgi:hypothetical protein